MPQIIFKDVTKKYEDKTIFDRRSIEFPANGFVCITGPSGIGKTTVFNMLLNLTAPDSGIVSVEDSARFSVVFQEDRLLPWSTVLENVMLPMLSSHGVSKSELQMKASEILTELGLEKELNSMPDELSGGMARRVSIARALLMEADIYLMDEPTKGLDEETRKKTLEIIKKYTCSHPEKLLVIITHNQTETAGAKIITI